MNWRRVPIDVVGAIGIVVAIVRAAQLEAAVIVVVSVILLMSHWYFPWFHRKWVASDSQLDAREFRKAILTSHRVIDVILWFLLIAFALVGAAVKSGPDWIDRSVGKHLRTSGDMVVEWNLNGDSGPLGVGGDSSLVVLLVKDKLHGCSLSGALERIGAALIDPPAKVCWGLLGLLILVLILLFFVELIGTHLLKMDKT